MGKRFQSRPPSRAVRLGLSAVLAIGLMPWGGVAVAAEGEGGSADAVASSFASVSGFYGWTSTHYSFDENGYPLYDKTETLSRSFILSILGMPICRAILW